MAILEALLLLAVALFSAASARAGTVTYYHNDLVGSPVVASDAAGQVLWQESYRPYGERLANPESANRLWYAGHAQDAQTGLVCMGARWYDPVAGRFVSVDPKAFDEANVQSFNRYAYANNNPYRYVDPDGRFAIGIFAWEVARVTGVGYVIGVAADAIGQGVAFGEVDWGMAARSSAAMAGAEASLVAGVFSGAGLVRSTAQAAGGGARGAAATAKELNKIAHVFPRAEKNLAALVRASGDSELDALRAVQSAANRALAEGRIAAGPNGILPGNGLGAVLDVNGTTVQLVGGRIVNGVVELGSFVGL